jgi:predicted metal-dependent peptidase
MPRPRRQPERPNTEIPAGLALVSADALFGALCSSALIRPVRDDHRIPRGEWAAVTSNSVILLNRAKRGEPSEWAYVIAHCLLHLAFEHLRESPNPAAWNLACDWAVSNFLDTLKFGSAPQELRFEPPSATGDLQVLYRLALYAPPDEAYRGDLILEPANRHGKPPNWNDVFGWALRQAVRRAVDVAGGRVREARDTSPAGQARTWFMNRYPLLGALAASFTIVHDPRECVALGIGTAAVSAADKTIWVNPAAGLDNDGLRFVIAHEILHAALRHDVRAEGRDFFLWNVACDYVINGWLIEMDIGVMPAGALHDPELAGLSAEEVYDRITTDLRRLRKLATFSGTGKPDMVGDRLPEWWQRGEGVELDELYRRLLAQGLELQEHSGRGLVPAGLAEEIRARLMPPIPWDVELARWLDTFFPIPETQRSYARPSRRQSATPDIPRPRVRYTDDWDDARTFGVLLDTSGSMDHATLGLGLGAVASYCASREVPAVRVVFCDAAAYDAGYLAAEDVAGRVRVRGRGGTILQPGVTLLREGVRDFPPSAPLLVITDTYCEPNLRVTGEHAFLVPSTGRLPFPPRGPVFRMPAVGDGSREGAPENRGRRKRSQS